MKIFQRAISKQKVAFPKNPHVAHQMNRMKIFKRVVSKQKVAFPKNPHVAMSKRKMMLP
jgi:hypothetical protein